MRPSRSRASSIASDTTNAALLGATTAFGRPQPPPRAPSNVASTCINSNGDSSTTGNEALAAATKAGYGHVIINNNDNRQQPSNSINSAGGGRGGGVGGARGRGRGGGGARGRGRGGEGRAGDRPAMDLSKMPSLMAVPQQQQQQQQQKPATHGRSPCQQAAVLASARANPAASTSSSNTPQVRPGTAHRPVVVAPKPRRLSSADSDDKPTDTTSIAPTTSLVNLFEEKANAASDPPTAQRPEPIVIKPSRHLPLKSPKPLRSGGLTSMFQLELEGRPLPTEQQSRKSLAPGGHDGQGQSSEDSFASASEDQHGPTPSSSYPRAQPGTWSPSPAETLRTQTNAKRRPQPPLASQQLNGNVSIRSAQPQPPDRPLSAQSDASSILSSRSMSIPAQYHALHPRKMTPLRTGDDLANAIVASSLASSRAPSPSRLEPPPVPNHRRKGRMSFSRTPSPARQGMLHTLRKKEETSGSEDEDEKHPYRKHQKKRHIRKHPNKHHEGSRKRWRDALTERERKRYEGVWAANKGLHYSFTQEEQQYFWKFPDDARTRDVKLGVNDQVSNIVARDIWTRSRLPQTTLEMVWALVDRDRVGRLQKEEFVVGMWLIDQRLKGRKLPTRVSDSVWTSVKGIGIKVRRK